MARAEDGDALSPRADRLHEALRSDGLVTSCDCNLPDSARIAARPGLPGHPSEAVSLLQGPWQQPAHRPDPALDH
ncbi:hypothetical protein ACWD04_21135 [Streptomyces sp. NPDC002911]